jgi:hypothetical protein
MITYTEAQIRSAVIDVAYSSGIREASATAFWRRVLSLLVEAKNREKASEIRTIPLRAI